MVELFLPWSGKETRCGVGSVQRRGFPHPCFCASDGFAEWGKGCTRQSSQFDKEVVYCTAAALVGIFGPGKSYPFPCVITASLQLFRKVGAGRGEEVGWGGEEHVLNYLPVYHAKSWVRCVCMCCLI